MGVKTCLECHKAGGDAEDSEFVLAAIPQRMGRGGRGGGVLRQNRDAFAAMARAKEGDQSRLLLKVVGRAQARRQAGAQAGLGRVSRAGGVRPPAERRRRPPTTAATMAEADKDAPPFFDGVVMLDDRRLLRRVTLSLAGRLPTDAELAAVASQGGHDALPALLDAVMKEDAFYDRLREGFNDIFLTLGFDGDPGDTCSRTSTSEDALWTEKYDLSHDRRREGAAAGPVQARRRLPQGAARRADEADRAHRAQRPAVHRDRHGRLHHGHAVHGPRVRRSSTR